MVTAALGPGKAPEKAPRITKDEPSGDVRRFCHQLTGLPAYISFCPRARVGVQGTLETFQDRLATEQHLADINAIGEATPGAGNVPGSREEVRPGRESADQETRSEGESLERGSGCIIERRRLTEGDIGTFPLRGQNCWTTTPSRHYHAIQLVTSACIADLHRCGKARQEVPHHGPLAQLGRAPDF